MPRLRLSLPSVQIVANDDPIDQTVVAEFEAVDPEGEVWQIRFDAVSPLELRCVARLFEQAAKYAQDRREDLGAESNYRIETKNAREEWGEEGGERVLPPRKEQ